MNQRNRHILIITTIVCIMLSLATLVIQKQKSNDTNEYVLLYIIAIMFNIVLNIGLNMKVVTTYGAKQLISLGQWVMPITGFAYLIPQVYSLMFPEQNMLEAFIYVFIGILFVISGNYFPKNHINPYVGLKFPWIMDDEENWYKTHKIGGYTWIISGVIFVLHPIHKFAYITVPLSIFLAGVIPLTYSIFLYYRKRKNTN